MIELNVKDFTKAARVVGAVIERRNTVPVLGTMRARANGRLELTGTDLDFIVKASIPCKATEEAEFIIPDHRPLVSAIGAAGGEEFSFTLASEGNGYCINAGALARETTHRIVADDWPADMSTPVDPTFSATLPASALRELERIAAAISDEETRYYLNGIHMKKLDGWTYRFAATDGHRLMCVDLQLPEAVEEFDAREVIIPRKFITQAFANYRKAEQGVTMKIGTGTIPNNERIGTAPAPRSTARVSLSGTVGNMDVVMAGKTIDGTYPDYSRVIPKEPPYQAVVSVANFRQAILAVSAGDYGQKTKPVKLSFDGDRLHVFAAFSLNNDTKASFVVDCKNNCPNDFSIGFNANYLLDMLAAIRGDEVRLGMTDPASPMTIHDTTDAAFMAVQMPMRV